MIRGTDGKDGVDGKDGDNGINGYNGKDGIDGKNGVDGKDGISVSGIAINDDNHLICTLSDGSTIDTGDITGNVIDNILAKDGYEIPIINEFPCVLQIQNYPDLSLTITNATATAHTIKPIYDIPALGYAQYRIDYTFDLEVPQDIEWFNFFNEYQLSPINPTLLSYNKTETSVILDGIDLADNTMFDLTAGNHHLEFSSFIPYVYSDTEIYFKNAYAGF